MALRYKWSGQLRNKRLTGWNELLIIGQAEGRANPDLLSNKGKYLQEKNGVQL